MCFIKAHEFQFYDSPIKSYCLKKVVFKQSAFQFYDSPIKRDSDSWQILAEKHRFQFYDSPIKRLK